MLLLEDLQDQVEWVEGDLLDDFSIEEALQGVDQVYHCAGLVSYRGKDRQRLMQVNAQGTANLVNACLTIPRLRLLHVSSIAAIGKKNILNEVVVEENRWENNRSISVYASSKFAAEQEVWRGIAEGLDAVIINPSIILGAGHWNAGSARLFTTVAKGYPFYTMGQTGYVDVRDVVALAIKLMDSDIHSERFILSAENWTFQQLFACMAQHLGVRPPNIQAGKWMGALAWRFGALVQALTGKQATITKTTARMALSMTQYDARKIQERLGYQFRAVEQTIAETAAAYRAAEADGKHHPLVM
jgi:nucleoside-diphosphate-sugar epimerase